MGVTGSKSRSLGQILENNCSPSRNFMFFPTFPILGQNMYLTYIVIELKDVNGKMKK